MTVAELIEELKKQDPEAPIILEVYGHHEHTDRQRNIGKREHMTVRALDKTEAAEYLNTFPGVLLGSQDAYARRRTKARAASESEKRIAKFNRIRDHAMTELKEGE